MKLGRASVALGKMSCCGSTYAILVSREAINIIITIVGAVMFNVIVGFIITICGGVVRGGLN